jgi:hypothetical protein
MKTRILASLVAVALSTACATNPPANAERGPGGTIAYYVKIESSDPGARVEVNSEYVGTTPVEVRVWGDPDGTFHNFGSSEFVVRVLPLREGQSAQTKTFRTGGWFSQEDQIPKRLFFDLNQKNTGGFTIDSPKPRY